MNYYARKIGDNGEFSNSTDAQEEAALMQIIRESWKCEIQKYKGAFMPIDFYITQNGALKAYAELKARSHASTEFGTVFFNLRKWLSLLLAHIGSGVSSFFIVKFSDEIRFKNVLEIDARKIKLAGCSRLVKSTNDIEPIIEVPVSDMKLLKRF